MEKFVQTTIKEPQKVPFKKIKDIWKDILKDAELQKFVSSWTKCVESIDLIWNILCTGWDGVFSTKEKQREER